MIQLAVIEAVYHTHTHSQDYSNTLTKYYTNTHTVSLCGGASGVDRGL